MKLAYIILCHMNSKLVAKTVKTLIKDTDNIAIIHVDAKSDIKEFEEQLSETMNVIFVKERVKVYWGGFSSIIATMNALKIALKYNCDRYILLQGTDYPLHSNKYIEEFFKKHKETEFLKAYNITKAKIKKNYMKCYGFHIFDGVDRRRLTLKSAIARFFSLINKMGIKYRKGYYYDRKNGNKLEIYWGWAHFALTHKCVQYLVEFYEKNERFNNYFKHIFPADETYIQTVVYNSSFAKKMPIIEENISVSKMLNLTYFEYPNQVKLFENVDELNKIDMNRYLYIRKINLNFCKQMDNILKG